MEFGIALPNFGKYAQRDAIAELAKTAEDLGFDSVWVSDHILIPKSHRGFGEVFYEPLTTLAYLAPRTKKILLGTSVIILPYRNPVMLAKMASTLDVLSGGRFILGVGTGWLKDEFSALGVPYQERGRITDERIEVLKILWTEEKPVFKGRYHEFSNISFFPKPTQKPHPPIWFGGNSKKAVERSVNLGEGWHPVGLTPVELEEQYKYVDESLIMHGKRRSDFVISLRKNLQISTKKKFDISDQRETLRGSADKITEGVRQYKKAGASHLVFQVLGRTLKEVIRTMAIFSKDIRPELDS